jgi:hypothetical protein
MDGRIFSSTEDVQSPLSLVTDWCRGYLLEDHVKRVSRCLVLSLFSLFTVCLSVCLSCVCLDPQQELGQLVSSGRLKILSDLKMVVTNSWLLSPPNHNRLINQLPLSRNTDHSSLSTDVTATVHYYCFMCQPRDTYALYNESKKVTDLCVCGTWMSVQ